MAKYSYKWGDAFTFGKYNGEAVDDIINQDWRYVNWAVDEDVIELDETLQDLLAKKADF